MPESSVITRTDRISWQVGDQTQLVVLERPAGDPILDFATAAAAGLTADPRSLPCRYLYDQRGSELFEKICELPEYYLTRTEASILARHAADIQQETGQVTLIELGSGTSVKTDYLLAAYSGAGHNVRYMPVDISESALKIAAQNINERYPSVQVMGILGQYELAFSLFREQSPSLVLFLGSTLGNLSEEEAAEFLSRISGCLSAGDYFLLGIDLVKDAAILEAAYNDSAGITAQFTENIFARMNRELDAGVDLDGIQHVATYDSERQEVDIRVRFLTEQMISITPLQQVVKIPAGETVRIEISKKFMLDDMKRDLAQSGFEVRRVFTDDEEKFAVVLLRGERW
jgi:L-histidine N-alpha-methyltransferase